MTQNDFFCIKATQGDGNSHTDVADNDEKNYDQQEFRIQRECGVCMCVSVQIRGKHERSLVKATDCAWLAN